MNKTYRNIWNTATGTWTAVAETARSRSKGSARAARQALAVLALGSASIGGAFAADACTTEDGKGGSLDAAGVCKVTASRTIGTDAIGTTATLTDDYIKVNSTGPVAAATGANAVAMGQSVTSSGSSSVAIGSGTSADGLHSMALGASSRVVGNSNLAVGDGATVSTLTAPPTNAIAIGTRANVSDAGVTGATGSIAIGNSASAGGTGSIVIGTSTRHSGSGATVVGANASAMGGGSGVAIGNSSAAAGAGSVATGPNATATGTGSVAIGSQAATTNNNSVAIGNTASGSAINTTAIGGNARATGDNATVLGQSGAASGLGAVGIGFRANAQGDRSVALGMDSVADRDNTVSVGSATQQRQITNVAAGTAGTDAVNVEQMNAAITAADKYVDIRTGTYAADVAASAGDSATAVGANASATGQSAVALGGNTTASAANAVAIGTLSRATGNNAVAVGVGAAATGANTSVLGRGALASGNNSVALGTWSLADRDNSVSVGSSGLERQVTNVAAGTQATDAVNVSQLQPVVTALGGGATINPTTGAVTGPRYTLANGGTQTTVGGALGALDGNITTINTRLDGLSNGTVGLVQQAGPGANITVGASTDGAAVDFTGTAGARKLTGVEAGAVTATSKDAVNGSQLHGVSSSVASAIGGGSTVNADGSISAPSFTLGDGSGGTTTVTSVGGAITNLDGRVTTNEGNIARNTGDIADLASQIGSGTVGLVQQAGAGANITVGANTDGAAVDFTGTAGARKLTGVDAGAVTAASKDAVNGSQLHGVSDSVASAIGGGSTVNADGSISAPSFTVGDGSGGTTTVHSVGDAVTNLDGRVTVNEGAVASLADQIGNGTVGLVQQAGPGANITVGANTDGAAVSFIGTAGARKLSGVANGVNDDDAVTIAQLKATGLIDYTGKEIAAVTYDDISLGSVTFGGTGGTKLLNVAPGLIAAGSMEAVNGGQLHDLQERFAQEYARLDGRVGNLESGGGSGGGGGGSDGNVGRGTGGDGSLVVGDGSVASGENSTAVGQGAVASGNNGSAVGQGSAASGSNSSAIGQGSVASGSDSTAIGQGSKATGNGSVAIGAGSVADRDNSVSVGSAGHERQITNVADGTAPTDAVNVRQLDQRFGETNRMINDVAKNAYAGVAAAMAMPNLTPSQPGKTVVAAGAANYKSGSAIAAGATYRTRDGKWLMNGAVSVTSTGDAGVRAQVGYEF
ncbi:YadA-like family protein [Burkholderia semiarida]|uniref:ESPR-type extended signal peptide-containing protein n=1 Tax=Burkholderia TaxID=32008 RepID=UPI00265F70EC|nr:ESPR-type extended signal peptide-containing protein [Burkholderia sp. AU44665]MDN7703159.1 YadA-like family protein [Burkholderia sp. AU44665]